MDTTGIGFTFELGLVCQGSDKSCKTTEAAGFVAGWIPERTLTAFRCYVYADNNNFRKDRDIQTATLAGKRSETAVRLLAVSSSTGSNPD